MDEVDAVIRDVSASLSADSIVVGVSAGERRRRFLATGRIGSREVTPGTVFYGASLAKQVIGMLVAMAEEQSVLHAEDLLSRWVPEVARVATGIRLRHLLQHTSGLRDESAPPMDTAEVLARVLARDDDPAPPGQTFEYCNAGYVLLGIAVERALGQSLEDSARERIFDPLEMRDTRLGGSPIPLSGTPDPPSTIGDGGLWISSVDAVTWLESLNAGWPNPRTSDRVLTRAPLNDGSALDYAWGVRLVTTALGPRITHGGSWEGWQSKSVRLPERGVAVVLLTTNAIGERVSQVALSLADQVAIAPA